MASFSTEYALVSHISAPISDQHAHYLFSHVGLDLNGKGSIAVVVWNWRKTLGIVGQKAKRNLLRQALRDLNAATSVAHASAAAALGHAEAGRLDEALNALLEIEPHLYDAQHLFQLSTYVNALGDRS